jgi:hypothetical protein
MARWTVLVGISIALASLGCASASAVTPGLANAPALGGVGAVEPGPYDVVSNGRDSCESMTGQSPLRGHVPPCPTVSHPVAAVPPSLLPRQARHDSLVLPWVEHFYVGFPCTHSRTVLGHWDAALSASTVAEGSCALPER